MYATAKAGSGVQSRVSLREESLVSKDQMDRTEEQFFSKRSAM